ncbi:mitochondrial 3-hydroxyisobutyryl-CoA hydrolase [Myxozyma melibiosi]|uniref:3-hydroxyisobutyryl-CoA hydrolase n=1 Tax=Myxozyma melibiosi TaxID=54550 RepID=A0ABR1FFW5_9ASCO
MLLPHARPLFRSSLRRSMPLRAKITNTAFLRMESTAAAYVPDDVLFESAALTRFIKLNRPKKLNALNLSMVEKIIPRLTAWRDTAAAVVVIKGLGGRALCAGGDVASLLDVAPEDSSAFFVDEYLLDSLIATYPKAVVAIMDGITMGGGAGLSMHTPFRIATEKTVFAMPETLIGFYPDVGAGFFLSRLDGELGTYLAMTGERLNGYDAYMAGVATHFVKSDNLQDVEARIVELSGRADMLDSPEDPLGVKKLNALLNGGIDDFQVPVPEGYEYTFGGQTGDVIDRCFSHSSLEEIMKALEADESEFAKKTLETMKLRCPLSMKVALELVRTSRNISIRDMFKRDMHLAHHFMRQGEFKKGVTYRVVEKQNGRADWAEAPSDSEIKSVYFSEELAEEYNNVYEMLDSFETGDYHEYPYHNGLPSESDVREYVLGESEDSGPYLQTKEEVIAHFELDFNGKAGVREKVDDILSRKTKVVRGDDSEILINWV